VKRLSTSWYLNPGGAGESTLLRLLAAQVEAVFVQTSLARALVVVNFDREVTGFGATDLELEGVRVEELVVDDAQETDIA
jgi:hypothetical protein